LPPYGEPLGEPVKSGLVVATEVVEPVMPPPTSEADNSGGRHTATEAVVTQAAIEPLVEATSGSGDVVVASSE
jgi:hypothetical protein